MLTKLFLDFTGKYCYTELTHEGVIPHRKMCSIIRQNGLLARNA